MGGRDELPAAEGNGRAKAWVAVAAAAAAFALYAKTLCPDIFWQDSGLFNRSVALLGSGVPPGSPGYHLLCYVFTLIPGVTAITGMNLFSAVAGAVGVFFLVYLFYEVGGEGVGAPAGAAVAALFYAAAPTVWLQGTTCEVYTLNIAFTAATMAALFAWRRAGDARWFYAAAFGYGLACTNHPQQAVLFVPYAFFVLLHRCRAGLRGRELVTAAALWLFAMSVYLYLPVRSAAGVAMDWGKPRTLYGLYFHMTAKEFQGQMFSAPAAVVWTRVKDAAYLYYAQFGWWGLGAAVAGAFILARRRAADAAYFAVVVLATLALTVNYNSFGFRAWFFVFYALTAVAAGIFVAASASALFRRRPAAGYALAVVAVVAAAAAVPVRFYRADRTYYPYSRDFSANLLRPVAYGGTLFLGEDNSSGTGGIEALTTCERRRPDITYIDLTGNANYRDIFDYAGERLARVPAAYASRRYLEILSSLLSAARGDCYFLYPYEYVQGWGYYFAYDGMLYRILRPTPGPWSNVWTRYISRDEEGRRTYLDYWGADMAASYLFMRGEDRDRRGDRAAAAADYGRAARVGARSAPIMHNLGGVYYFAGDYATAASYYGRAVSLDPTLSLSRYMLSRSYDGLGRAADAERERRDLRRYDPAFKPPALGGSGAP